MNPTGTSEIVIRPYGTNQIEIIVPDADDPEIARIKGLIETAGSAPVDLAQLSDAARLLLTGAMILGRLEALALIAFLNPEFWR